MRHVILRTLLPLLTALVPLSARAQVGVSVNLAVPLPPPIVFPAPPQVVVLPETQVYVVPDVEAEIFFSRGWWWRPWQGRWYRSRHHDHGWVYYRSAPPPFYRRVPPGWRNDFREHRWKGREWKHERIPHGDVAGKWRGPGRPRPGHAYDSRGAGGMGPRSVGPRGGGQAFQPAPPRGGGHAVQPPRGPRPGGPPHGRGHGPGPGRGHGPRR